MMINQLRHVLLIFGDVFGVSSGQFFNAGGACHTGLQRLEFLPGTKLQICPVAGPVAGSQPWSFEGRFLGGSLEGSGVGDPPPEGHGPKGDALPLKVVALLAL